MVSGATPHTLKNQFDWEFIEIIIALLEVYAPKHVGISSTERSNECRLPYMDSRICFSTTEGHRVLAQVHGLAFQYRQEPVGVVTGVNPQQVFLPLLS